ncbi:MAG TPA: hypothetical protein VHU23_13220 [Rhizomicrobium sp.]|jgi:hypothetical protein|nr:hypothetical protein [Rhizomicrobium sp.]
MRARKGKPDPIFAGIEKHAAAVKAHDRARAALRRLEARINARASERKKSEGQRLTVQFPTFFFGGPKICPHWYIRDRQAIKQHVWETIDRASDRLMPKARRALHSLEKEAVAEMERAFDRFRKRHEAERGAAGLSAAAKADDATECAQRFALSALMNVQPTTAQGAKALAKHLAGLDPSRRRGGHLRRRWRSSRRCRYRQS